MEASKVWRCHSSGVLSCENRFERCLPVSSEGCSILSLSPFSLEGWHIWVNEPPFQSSDSSTDILKSAETGCSFPKESGGVSNHLSGRHSADGVHPNTAEITRISYFPRAHSPVIRSEWSQMHTGSSTIMRLSWVHDRLEDHDHCPPREQGAKDPKGLSSYALLAECHSSTTCPSNGINDSMLTCYHCSPSSLR